jgi:integrase/recombinase XerD
LRNITSISAQASDIISAFITDIKSKYDLNPKTLAEYSGDIKHFVRWYETLLNEFSDASQYFNPENISTPIIIDYRTEMQKSSKLKANTINRRLKTLKRFFTWIKSCELIKSNPCTSVKLVKSESVISQQMTEKQISDLVAAVNNSGSLRDQTIMIVLIQTGIRTMELCNLLKSDIIIGKRSGTLIVRAGKRNKNREVPLNSTCREYLTRYLATTEYIYLFPSEKTQNRLTERAIRYMVKKYMTIANIENLSAHALRHHFGYVMVQNTPIHRLAQIMGHDRLDTTMTYLKATKEDLQKEVEKIAWK